MSLSFVHKVEVEIREELGVDTILLGRELNPRRGDLAQYDRLAA